jgi:hypothetical protein
MKNKYIKLLGSLSLILGVFLVMNAEAGITGAVIGTPALSSTISFILGLVFLIVGIEVLAGGEEGGLEKKFDKEEAKKIRNTLLKLYRAGKIDETEFASSLNEQVGELTGGVYKPRKQLSVKITPMRYPLKIEGELTNADLALALHRRILANSQEYKPYCQFNYSRKASTKDHLDGLKKLGL